MAIRFVMGPAGCGKTHTVLNEIVSRSIEYPKQSFLVIAPEQFNLKTQALLTNLHPGGVILNIDVLSFNRLAYNVFNQVGFNVGTLLEEIGKIFILQKIALNKGQELPVIGSRMKKPGGLDEMKSVLSEMMQYDITIDKLEKYIDQEKNSLMKAKMTDILNVYKAYKEELGDRFMTAEEVPDKLCELVEESELIKDAVLVFDGFTGFTPIQLRLIRKMMPMASEMIFTATCDPKVDPDRARGQENLFAMSSDMVRRVREMAKDAAIPVSGIEWIKPSGVCTKNSKELTFLEQHLLRYDKAYYPDELKDVHLFEYTNPIKEAQNVARQIIQLVRTKGFHYRDIAILTGDMDTYGAVIRGALTHREIPCFIDEKQPLLNNPFVEAIRGAMDACVDNYSYQGIFRFLKTGMSPLTEDQVNRLENHVIACGIRGKSAWRKEWVYAAKNETEEELKDINLSRQKVCATLDPLSEALAKRGASVQEKASALYQFCLDNDIENRLNARKDQLNAQGLFDLGSIYGQVYGKIISILDKLVEVLGEEHLTQGEFCDLIETGLSSLTIGIIPQKQDQVLVGDLERSRLDRVKVLFMVGVNEGQIPKAVSEGGFLTEADREKLKENELALRPSPREQVFIQNFYLYLALTKPDSELYLSYCLRGNDGTEWRPSYLLKVIRQLFPTLTEEREPEKYVDRIEQRADGLPLVAEGIRGLKSGQMSAQWEEIYKWHRGHEEDGHKVDLMLQGLKKDERYDGISRQAAKRLYGTHFRNSATRLETMAGCPFRHFAAYGLNLKEREEYDFTALDRGNILHKALEYCGQAIKKEDLMWSDLTEEERRDLVDRSLAEASGDQQYFTDNERNAYEIQRLKRELDRTVWAMGRQMAAGSFEIGELEKKFNDDLLKSAHLKLEDGSIMSLTGRIDRIDLVDQDGRRYLKIVDYKTGSKSFDISEVYHGLQLQLVLYMNAAVELEKMKHPDVAVGGIFYQKVADPMMKFADAPTKEEQENVLLEDLRASGLVCKDLEVLRLFDKELSPGVKSKVIPVKLKKDETPDATSKVLSQQDFGLLGRYAMRKALTLANQIINGNIQVAPYKLSDKVACKYCPYASVCAFDERMNGCQYRKLHKNNLSDVLDQMRQDMGEEEEET